MQGRALAWSGTDRFRLRHGMAIEGTVVFDTRPLREALAPRSEERARAG